MIATNSAQNEFFRRRDDLVEHRRKLGDGRFFATYEGEVMQLLERFESWSSDIGYKLLARGLFYCAWKGRLGRLNDYIWLRQATRDELIDTKNLYIAFFDAVNKIPYLKEIVGDDWICRRRSWRSAVEAELHKRWKIASVAIRLFDEAAEELEKIAEPSVIDRADAAWNRASSRTYQGFACFRQNDFTNALTSFRSAARYARRRQELRKRAGFSEDRWLLRFSCYWKHVAAVSMRTLEGGFARAQKHLQLACKYAKQLPSFPREKWFVCLGDLENQSLVISAYEAFLRGDFPGAQSLLSQWMENCETIQQTGRRLRIVVRKLAVDALVASQEKGRPAMEPALKELERVLQLRKFYGRNELFIQETLRALFNGVTDNAAAAKAVQKVIVVEAPPVEGQPFDPVTPEQRAFVKLPPLFWDWVMDVDPDDLDADEHATVQERMCYVLLLYVRCVAEFWCGVFVKRQAEGAVIRFPRQKDASLRDSAGSVEGKQPRDAEVSLSDTRHAATVDIPDSFATTNWDGLGRTLDQLGSVFTPEPTLRDLYEKVQRFRDSVFPKVSSGHFSAKELRDFVIDTITSTQNRLFPHPVLLESHADVGRGLVCATLRRIWRSLPRQLKLTFGQRTGQKLVPGSYYFMKPVFKGKAAEVLEDSNVVLHPLRPSTCFGEPPGRKVALLLEGVDDCEVFRTIFTALNPHWQARVELVDCGGTNEMVDRFAHLTQTKAYSCVMVVGDIVGGARVLLELERRHAIVFRLNPDLEGVQPYALAEALKEVMPDLVLSDSELQTILSSARAEKKATTKLIEAKYREKVGQVIYYDDMERIKRALAHALPKKMLQSDIPNQILEPAVAALRAGFGHT